ncbi:unnamed protein product [Euphydryas editha]|uniref:Uncharacterized protein n=1 Tax=Euphydryas editha TaxID=104508 RepID=A0AAU9VD33_EUPED|nr:unnamed protein product [Euphydryas editha]
MRACAAILILSAWPCFIQAINSRTSHETSSNFADTSDNAIHEISMCAKNLGITKCIGAYGDWRAERVLEGAVHRRNARSEKFPWQIYKNISDEELYTKLCDNTERLLERRSLKLDLSRSYSLELGSKGNGSLSVDILKCDDVTSGRSSTKKLQKQFYKIMPLLLLPGLIMSAILPFVLPSLKMMTLAAGMLNNMALTGAVFTLLRNNAFDDTYQKKVIYVNNGYLNDKYEPLADTPSHAILDGNFNHKYNDFETHENKNYHFIENLPPIDDYKLNSEWLKGITTGKVRNINIFPENFHTNEWRKRDEISKDLNGPDENPNKNKL